MNSKFALCNRLHIYGNRLPAVFERFNLNSKECNRLHTYCNRLPEEFFRKHSHQSHPFMWLLNGFHKAYICVTWDTILTEFFRTKSVYPLREQIHFILLRILWPIQLQFIKDLFERSICKNLSLSREIYSSSSSHSLRD